MASGLRAAALALREILFNASDLSDPKRLYQVLYQMQVATRGAFRLLSVNPTLLGNVIPDVTFTPGQTLLLNHGLGRAYQGWYPIRVQGAVWSGAEAAFPPGATPDKILPLTSANASLVSFWCF